MFKGVPDVAIYRAIDDLLEEGMLARKGVKYPTLWIPEKRVRPKSTGVPRRPVATGLEGKLKAFRKKEARRRRWKAYQVFPDATLHEMMVHKPLTLDELGAIKGMGPKRLSKFGTGLLELIAEG
ncbi:MAG: hypothetical protein GWP91_19045 [Rhodobacterales bacterium]|nr:hypothetical protein [Rhodobacterales bacterium]